MQAIQTKYLPATNFKGSRIKAWCERGSITIDYPHDSNLEHRTAADALVAKFVKEDKAKYGEHPNPWDKPRASGGLPSLEGDVFCYADHSLNQRLVEFASREDAELFDRFVAEARKRDGTPAPLHCGLVASALKKAKI